MDHWVALLLAPLAFWIVFSGLDDLAIDLAAAVAWARIAWARRIRSRDPRHKTPTDEELSAVPPRHMAVYVALWREDHVIQNMLDNNLARLNYPRVDFFVGAYPNDSPTLAAVREAMKRHPNVHLSLCPHDGPTSKADCLNWIYQRMLLHEEENAVRFEMIVIHDAEDIIDPDALLCINYFAQWYDMIQIPVLALPTPLTEITHGVYCDEFCESQYRDMMARSLMGGFIPSNGVGAGFSRHALELLAAAYSNRIFESACLTEDYENGFRIANLGLRQKFIPIHFRHGRAVATREYFPRRFTSAVRQRSRWITGIGLQSWEFHSLSETMQHWYWFWRDRKSLVSNVVGPLANLLFLYGLVTLAWDFWFLHAWGLGRETAWLGPEAAAVTALLFLRTGIRIWCCSRIYGLRFAIAVPVRLVAGNWMNCFATCRAVFTYTAAKFNGKPLRWVKTEHAYPNRTALLTDRKQLGAILTARQWITQEQLNAALASPASAGRLGERLLAAGTISEDDLYTALALQNQLPVGKPEPAEVSLPVTRALPSALARKWRVLPFRIAAGELYVAGSEIPGNEMQQAIRQFSSLGIRFRLVTPTDFAELETQYLVQDLSITRPSTAIH